MVRRPRHPAREGSAGIAGVPGAEILILRKPYKRAAPPAPVLRKPYKRGRPSKDDVLPPLPPEDKRPRWFRDALFSGAMRCPRKWSDLALETCSQIQEIQIEGCRAVRCAFAGTASMLMDEVRACKKSGVAPKIGPRGKLAIVAVES